MESWLYGVDIFWRTVVVVGMGLHFLNRASRCSILFSSRSILRSASERLYISTLPVGGPLNNSCMEITNEPSLIISLQPLRVLLLNAGCRISMATISAILKFTVSSKLGCCHHSKRISWLGFKEIAEIPVASALSLPMICLIIRCFR